ncbi:MAG: hypothetical protein NVS2B4_05400 [Ramlibacter sp.]
MGRKRRPLYSRATQPRVTGVHMPSPPKKQHGKQRPDDPYLPGDAIPEPEVVEKNSDTSWALFNELAERREHKFSPTIQGSVPAPLPDPDTARAPGYDTTTALDLAPGPAPTERTELGLDELMIEARRNNRVCPRLDAWGTLYDMLPDKQMVDGKPVPPPPISPQAWRITSAMVKRLCLRDHLEWAASHDAVMPVLILLRSLPEAHWLHME